MEPTEISKGDKVELEVKFQNKVHIFPSIVQLTVDNSVLITKIVKDDQTIGFTGPTNINFICHFNGRLYRWENVTISLVRYDGEIFHRIGLTGSGKSYNRRQSYRIYIGNYMKASVNTASGASLYDILVKDISEGGLGFISPVEFDLNRTIRLNYKDKDFSIYLHAIIVRKEYNEELKTNSYGCRFTQKENKLNSYLMKKQSENLRNKINSYKKGD